MKLGVITSEFFDPAFGGMGGFGWAARQVAQTFHPSRSQGVDLVLIATEHFEKGAITEAAAHDTRVILRSRSRLENFKKMRAENFDLLLTVDYTLAHSVYLRSLPRTPTIIWVRDPRTPQDVVKIQTCRIPDNGRTEPQGLFCYDASSMRRIVREAWWFQRRLLFASPAPTLIHKLADAYGAEPPNFYLLPNIVELRPAHVIKNERPTIVFLGRLDPIKRPWLFVELARRFPEADFLLLGQPHFHGVGGYAPAGLPSNVRVFGHVGEAQKLKLLTEAWIAVNCSIHEGLAVSFLEAFACETVLLSGQDPDHVASRFGHYYGQFNGDGREGLDAMESGLRLLIDDESSRRDLGRAAREWVNQHHTEAAFLASFNRLRALAGVA